MTASNDSERVSDGVDRRGFLECMAWAGTGLLWTMGGGIASSRRLGQGSRQSIGRVLVCPDQRQPHRLRQGPEQDDVIATFQKAIAQDQCAAASRPTF